VGTEAGAGAGAGGWVGRRRMRKTAGRMRCGVVPVDMEAGACGWAPRVKRAGKVWWV
jgi:hypothetical protein